MTHPIIPKHLAFLTIMLMHLIVDLIVLRSFSKIVMFLFISDIREFILLYVFVTLYLRFLNLIYLCHVMKMLLEISSKSFFLQMKMVVMI